MLHRTVPLAVLLLLCRPPVLAVEPPAEALSDPPAEHIPGDELQDACAEAVANGILALFERMHAEDNDEHYIYPPVVKRTVVDYREVERRYTWKTFTRPKVKRTYKTVERLVPKKNRYGDVIGYEKKKVRVCVKSERVGTETYKRLVADPEGEIVKTRRVPIWGYDGPRRIPEGWYGCNGMGLYLLGRAGFGERRDVQTCALYLEKLLRDYGMPDHTWDVAWLAMGLARIPGEEHAEWTRRCADKLIDGHIAGRERGLGGLWGPVAIDHALVARFFAIELKLHAEIERLAGIADVEEPTRRSESARKAKVQLEKILQEVISALDGHSMHGRRLESVTRPMTTGEYVFPGLPYYIYNRRIADVDSTAIAAFALAELQAAEALPEETTRPRPGGRRLTRPHRSADVIRDAYRALVDATERSGTYTAINAIGVNDAYDDLTLAHVPFRGRHPPLPRPESLRSRLHGHLARACLAGLYEHAGRDAAELAAQDERAADAMLRILEAAGERDFHRRHIHAGEEMSAEELMERKGAIPVSDWEERPAEELPVGHLVDLHEFLTAALALHRPPAAAGERRRLSLHARLAYRLLLTQGTFGLWGRNRDRRRDFAWSNAEYELRLRKLAGNRYRQLERQVAVQGKKIDEKTRGVDIGRAIRHAGNDQNRTVSEDIFRTGTGLVYLYDNLDRPLPLGEEEIDAAIDRLEKRFEEINAAAEAPAEGDADADGAAGAGDGDEAAAEEEEEEEEEAEFPGHFPRPNEALPALWVAILESMGEELPDVLKPSDPEPAAEGEGEATPEPEAEGGTEPGAPAAGEDGAPAGDEEGTEGTEDAADEEDVGTADEILDDLLE